MIRHVSRVMLRRTSLPNWFCIDSPRILLLMAFANILVMVAVVYEGGNKEEMMFFRL